MIRKFNTKLLFTDIGSLCYEIYEKNLHKKMYKYKELFDLINLPLSSKYSCSNSKIVLCKMKDEYGGKSISKFLALNFKMYSILNESNNKKVTSKGHNSFIEFQEFYDTVFKKKKDSQTRKEKNRD